MPPSRPPSHCAVCGAEIPPRARACLECGADERTGWAEQSIYDGLELPEESFHDEPPSKAEEEKVNRARRAKSFFWWCVALFLLLVFIAGALALR